MRKPLVALSLVLSTGFGATPIAGALAAPTNGDSLGTTPTTSYPSSASSSARSSNAVSGAQIVQTAFRYLGDPYSISGDTPQGFSCIGFVSYVYRANGIPLPGSLDTAMAYASPVPFSNLQPGDILYFGNTIWRGLSHTAIYVGGGRFIHAEWYNRGVVVSSFNNDRVDGNYWIGKYIGANRPWGGAAVAPIIGAPEGGPPSPPGVSVTRVIGGKRAIVVVSSLNVRSGPSRQSAVQTIVPQGTNLVIRSRSHGWYEVQLPDGATGWVIAYGIGKGGAVSPATTTTSNPNIGTPTAPTRTGFPAQQVRVQRRATTAIRVSGLRVHTSPSVSAAVVTSVGRGEHVQVLARSNGWMKIRTSGGYVGWVVAAYTSGARRTSSRPTYNKYAPRPAHRSARRTSFARGPMLTAGVRVHAAPGMKTRVIGLAAAGTHVLVLGHSGRWTLVRLPSGQVGYVFGAFVG